MRFIMIKLLICLAICNTCLCSGCNSINTTSVPRPSSNHYANKSVQALIIADSIVATTGQPLTFLFTILNGTNNKICFDGRMAYPGNLDLYVKLPNSQVIRAITLAVKLANPTEKDIVNLPPNTLYGTRITLDPSERITSPELKKPKPGIYTFWVEFYSRELASHKCKELSLKSNSVSIVIEDSKQR